MSAATDNQLAQASSPGELAPSSQSASMADEIVLRLKHCFRCGQDFYSRLDPPRSCGKCKSRSWHLPIGAPGTRQPRRKVTKLQTTSRHSRRLKRPKRSS